MTKRLGLLLVLAVIAVTFMYSPVQAEDRPIQLSLVSPIQIFPEDYSITGVRLSLIYGRNTSVTGLDWGLVNHTTAGTTTGIQFGLVGLADADFVGWQDNGVNVVKGNFKGLQWGAVNYANYANGIQIALVNYSVSMNGLQLGLVNIIKQGGMFPVFPIVNWSFED
jgi:hypothetical protein